MPEIRVNSWVYSEEIKVEFAGVNVVHNHKDEVRKDGSLRCDFLDDNVVLISINENDWIGALEDKVETLEVFVEDFDLDLIVFVEDGSFVVMVGVNGDKYFLFVFRVFPKIFDRR